MILHKILKEITSLTASDCFTVFFRKKKEFDFPLHYHEEYELNFVWNATGARRVVGDHMEEIGQYELALIGPNLPHCWQTHECKSQDIQEITIQFHKDLFDEKLLRRNQLYFLRDMLEKSKRGILFSPETARTIEPEIRGLRNKQGFDSVLELMSVLHSLSISRNMRILSDASFSNLSPHHSSRRIEKAIEYMNLNFDKPISLADVAGLNNMTEVSFSRFFRMQTGSSFMDSLIDIRLGHATRLLIATQQSISEVAYNCGFNNISNFNRIFKKRKSCTPKEFRDNYIHGSRIFF